MINKRQFKKRINRQIKDQVNKIEKTPPRTPMC